MLEVDTDTSVPPISIVALEIYKVRNLFVADPKSYVIFVSGIKLERTVILFPDVPILVAVTAVDTNVDVLKLCANVAVVASPTLKLAVVTQVAVVPLLCSTVVFAPILINFVIPGAD